MILKDFVDNWSFNELCREIKKNSGKVSEEVIEKAFVKAYEMAEMIAIRNAKRHFNFVLSKIDVENFGADVYIAVKRNFSPEKPPHDLNNFVNRVIDNKIADLLKIKYKDKNTEKALEKEIEINASYKEEEQYLMLDDVIILKEALKKMKPEQREILALVAQKYSTKEIIKELGLKISEDAMRQRIRECRKRLDEIVGDYHGKE